MEYDYIIVQSVLSNESGQHGFVHIKPLPNQEPYLSTMFVECAKELSRDYPVGTKFRIKAKIKKPKSNEYRPHVYSNYRWPYSVLKD